MDYPKRWSSLFAYHQKKIDDGICGLYDPEDQNRTFSILLLPNEESRKEIHKILKISLHNLSEDLVKKLYVQFEKSIHFSVQWCDKRKVKGKKQIELIDKTVDILDKVNSISGELYLPFMGYGNLYGLMKTGQIDEFVQLRESIQKIFDFHSLKTGIPKEDFDLVHTSLVRSYSPLTNSEREEFRAIQMQKINVVLDEVVIAFNDKVFNLERSEVLYKRTLS